MYCVIAVCIEEVKGYMDNKIYENNCSDNLAVFSKGNSNDTKYFSCGFSGNLTHRIEKMEQILQGKPDYSALSFGRMMEHSFGIHLCYYE